MNTEVIKKIAKGLNDIGCTWGIGGSVLLNRYNLVDKPNDIDILVKAKDADNIKMFMDTIGETVYLPSKEPFKTEAFFGYIVDGIMVEFLGNFKIDLGNGKLYEFVLDEKSVTDYKLIDNIKVNFTSLEDWLVAYIVMGDPKKRVNLIENYFINNKVKNIKLLERNLNQNLTEEIKTEINSSIRKFN
ncbi:hypothetical protein [Romboutsia lituseburensis]|uniref:hypothetical protein n=1 Tax=Romboutsia lituseburensis TaxID=1537 RepID=UPI00215A66BF|nr:hypothetical protein [Romboutsia lituseburensis]MCR8747083.1 hypothetical protein [Romboutsia lituseburensis]